MPAPGECLNLAGQRYGRLLALRIARRTPKRVTFWLCRCDCGSEAEISISNLRGGNTTSCGCVRREVTTATSTTHGHGGERRRSPTYWSWCSMWSRVRATTGRRFKDYGARGITACDRWLSFENFLADMGLRPPTTSLDRIDNDGNYEPGNCRWATASQQNSNQRPRPLHQQENA